MAARVRLVVAAYAALAVCCGAVAHVWRGGSPLLHPTPWFDFGWSRHAVSIGMGLGLGVAVIVSSRLLVGRIEWARELHSDLRPLARQLSGGSIVAVAVLSSLGEELLFRGLLQPWLGLVGQAVVFGLAHQLKGRSRLPWILWTMAVGLAFGAVFQASGSLAGALVAHALVNCVNLQFLKQHDPRPAQKALGGLLNERGQGV